MVFYPVLPTLGRQTLLDMGRIIGRGQGRVLVCGTHLRESLLPFTGSSFKSEQGFQMHTHETGVGAEWLP